MGKKVKKDLKLYDEFIEAKGFEYKLGEKLKFGGATYAILAVARIAYDVFNIILGTDPVDGIDDELAFRTYLTIDNLVHVVNGYVLYKLGTGMQSHVLNKVGLKMQQADLGQQRRVLDNLKSINSRLSESGGQSAEYKSLESSLDNKDTDEPKVRVYKQDSMFSE